MKKLELVQNDETVEVRVAGQVYRVPRCAWIASGKRCAYPGTISHTTMNGGPSGKEPPVPSYCRFHFDCHDAKFGALVVEQSHEPRAPIQPEEPTQTKYFGSGADGLNWARRIRERIDAGEPVTFIARTWAEQALQKYGRPDERSRNQGGDDEHER